MPVRFRLFGSVEAEVNGRRLELGHARQRCVLAVLLVDADRIVPVDVVLDRVWAGRLPKKARVTLSGYVSRLRQLLAAAPEITLTHQAGGYRLAVDPMSVDLHHFRALVAEARATTAREERVALFAEALGLWQGEPFAGLDTPWCDDVRDELAADRLAAELDRNDLALDQGQHAALLPGLTANASAHPWDERLAGQLMVALYRCGRQADALHHYERLRSHLARELGADPSPPLRQLHQRILTADPSLAAADRTSTPTPRQLPAPPASFTGRADALARLDALVRTEPSTVVISAVSGTAGIGKTALALHWAHRAAGQFPDGQLYANLRGFEPNGAARHPSAVTRAFLTALGVSPHRVPDGLDAQTALYRSTLSGRRVLVVLDNARDAGQVEPLLPGTSGCVVLVTSRNQLTSLVAGQGAHPVTLDLLTAEEARELLARRVGADRAAAEPDAVDEIVTRCSRLPLALAIAAARAATRPHLPLHTLAAELRDSRRRLDTLADPNPRTDVRAVFSWSYDTLGAQAARLFRLLGPLPGPDVTASAAASLAGLPLPRTRRLLTELAEAHLLTEHVPGRYTCHDLLRAYAAEQSDHHDTGADRRAATHRLLDHHLHTARAASLLIDPYQADPLRLSPTRDGVVADDLADQDHAMAWFAAEYPALLAAVSHAAHHGFASHAWSLAWSLGEYGYRRGHWSELSDALDVALSAATRVGDQRGQAHVHRGLGITHHMRGRYQQARDHFERALDLFGDGDNGARALVHCNMGMALERLAGPHHALAHAQRALDLQRRAGDRIGQGRALNVVGWYHVAVGEHERAVACLEEGLALLRDPDDRLGQAVIWDSLGYAHHHLGHHQQALECYQHALALDRYLGNRYLEATTLAHLGDTHHATGNRDLARDTWCEALSNLDDLDHPEADEVRAKLAAIR